VLINADGHIKLTDFGFAKRLEKKTYTLCGTPEYIAPEVISSKGYGMDVDWWSLGILLFEMCEGVPPFYANETVAIYQKILRGKFFYSRRFDAPQKALISALLQASEFRLGGFGGGARQVQNARWWNSLDWNGVARKELTPLMIPTVTSADDTSCFEKYPDSVDAARVIPSDSQRFFHTFSSLTL